VEGFATREEWKRSYGEIVDFERGLAAEGMIFVKLWLHLSADEQLNRFREREKNPLKRWKLTDEDWRNREERSEYEEAVEEMFDRTESSHSRWHVISAESKRYARVEVIRTVIAEIEAGCARWGFELP